MLLLTISRLSSFVSRNLLHRLLLSHSVRMILVLILQRLNLWSFTTQNKYPTFFNLINKSKYIYFSYLSIFDRKNVLQIFNLLRSRRHLPLRVLWSITKRWILRRHVRLLLRVMSSNRRSTVIIPWRILIRSNRVHIPMRRITRRACSTNAIVSCHTSSSTIIIMNHGMSGLSQANDLLDLEI